MAVQGIERVPNGLLVLRAFASRTRLEPELDIAQQGWDLFLQVLGRNAQLAL
jgi:hypothetical protein